MPGGSNTPMEKSTHIGLFESVEELVRAHVRDFIEEIVEDEVTQALDRARYARGGSGYRNGHRERTVVTTLGEFEVSVPRARIETEDGQTEFRSSVLPKGKRLTANAEALIVSSYLCGVSTRKCSVALARALGSGVSKSAVSRCLQRLRPNWEAWQKRELASDDIVRLILDGIGVPVRIGGKSERMTVLVAMGVRRDGQRLVLAFKAMGAESKASWLEILEDLSSRGVKQPELVIADGSKGLEAALSEVWPQALVQRCTVHKERNLLAKAPESLHEELKADYAKMMYADTAEEALQRRAEFLAKWRSKCPGVAKSLEEAGDRLFSFLRFPPQQWKTIRTTNAIERLNEKFQAPRQSAGSPALGRLHLHAVWALLASGAVLLRRLDGFQTMDTPPRKEVTLAA